MLRSRKTNDDPTRVDVLLQDVRAMELRTWFSGIKIEEVGLEYLEGFRSNPISMIEPGNKVYSVRGDDWLGFIVGGIIAVREDDGEFMSPSWLLGASIHNE